MRLDIKRDDLSLRVMLDNGPFLQNESLLVLVKDLGVLAASCSILHRHFPTDTALREVSATFWSASAIYKLNLRGMRPATPLF
jgi:hypothetical protein